MVALQAGVPVFQIKKAMCKMFRILHVIQTLSPRYGGPVTALNALVKEQARAGHDVTVCTTDCGSNRWDKLPGDYYKSLYPDNVQLRVFTGTFTPLLVSFELAKWLSVSVRYYDIVHIHGLYRFPATYAAYQARRQNVPYVIRPHGALDPYLYDKSSRSVLLKRLYESWFDLPNLHAAGAIHFTAEEERERVSFLKLKAPSFVIPNGVDWTRFEQLPSPGAFRAAYGYEDEPLVLFLGRLHFKKGLDLLIPSFHVVRLRNPGAKLAIVGPDNDGYGKKVQRWISEYGLNDAVRFIEHLDDVKVLQAYVDADVFVLPSYTENFGMTVVEAMACGLPVVISDQVNIHAEVEAAGAGLVTHCNVAEIADAVCELLEDTGRRKIMGQAGRREVQMRYTWPVIVGALSREYEQVIERAWDGQRQANDS